MNGGPGVGGGAVAVAPPAALAAGGVIANAAAVPPAGLSMQERVMWFVASRLAHHAANPSPPLPRLGVAGANPLSFLAILSAMPHDAWAVVSAWERPHDATATTGFTIVVQRRAADGYHVNAVSWRRTPGNPPATLYGPPFLSWYRLMHAGALLVTAATVQSIVNKRSRKLLKARRNHVAYSCLHSHDAAHQATLGGPERRALGTLVEYVINQSVKIPESVAAGPLRWF